MQAITAEIIGPRTLCVTSGNSEEEYVSPSSEQCATQILFLKCSPIGSCQLRRVGMHARNVNNVPSLLPIQQDGKIGSV